MRILSLLVGFICVFTSILLKICVFWVKDTNEPFSKGFIRNLLIASKRYSATNLIRRMYFIWKKPELTWQYIAILNKRVIIKIQPVTVLMPIRDLTMGHDVFEEHDHHETRKKRAMAYFTKFKPFITGEIMKYIFGTEIPIVVLNNVVCDGNHRVKILKELAPHSMVEVLYYRGVENES